MEKNLSELTPALLQYIRSFKTLMHPSTMGMAFKFICFSKNVPYDGEEPLVGFRRCGDGRATLGLSAPPGVVRGDPDDPYAAF